jgi:hypothetical protein
MRNPVFSPQTVCEALPSIRRISDCFVSGSVSQRRSRARPKSDLRVETRFAPRVCTVSKQDQIVEPFSFFSKNIEAPGAALSDMHRHSRHDNTCGSGHGFIGGTGRKILGAERKGRAVMSATNAVGKKCILSTSPELLILFLRIRVDKQGQSPNPRLRPVPLPARSIPGVMDHFRTRSIKPEYVHGIIQFANPEPQRNHVRHSSPKRLGTNFRGS